MTPLMQKIFKSIESNKECIRLAKQKIFNRRKLDEKEGIEIGDNYLIILVNNCFFKNEFEQVLHYLECEPTEDIDLILKIARLEHESVYPLNRPLNQ